MKPALTVSHLHLGSSRFLCWDGTESSHFAGFDLYSLLFPEGSHADFCWLLEAVGGSVTTTYLDTLLLSLHFEKILLQI